MYRGAVHPQQNNTQLRSTSPCNKQCMNNPTARRTSPKKERYICCVQNEPRVHVIAGSNVRSFVQYAHLRIDNVSMFTPVQDDESTLICALMVPMSVA